MNALRIIASRTLFFAARRLKRAGFGAVVNHLAVAAIRVLP